MENLIPEAFRDRMSDFIGRFSSGRPAQPALPTDDNGDNNNNADVAAQIPEEGTLQRVDADDGTTPMEEDEDLTNLMAEDDVGMVTVAHLSPRPGATGGGGGGGGDGGTQPLNMTCTICKATTVQSLPKPLPQHCDNCRKPTLPPPSISHPACEQKRKDYILAQVKELVKKNIQSKVCQPCGNKLEKSLGHFGAADDDGNKGNGNANCCNGTGGSKKNGVPCEVCGKIH